MIKQMNHLAMITQYLFSANRITTQLNKKDVQENRTPKTCITY